MNPRRRRIALMALAIGIMVAVVAAQRKEQPVSHNFRITFGLKDEKPADWSGKLHVTGGEVVSLEGWRFEAKDEVLGKNEWKCSTHDYIAPGDRFPLGTPDQPNPPTKTKPWPNGLTLALKGDQPAVTVTFAQGKVEFKASEIKLGEPKKYLDDRVQVERVPEVSVLPSPIPGKPGPQGAGLGSQDDYPALWIHPKTNQHYLAWVSYYQGKDRVLLAYRDGPEAVWSEPVEVEGPGDHFRVALAGTHGEIVWIVYSSQRKGNWDLYARPCIDNKVGHPEVRLTDAPGPDIWHRMTTDVKGRAWLVWQGFRDGQSDIFARCADAEGWHPPIKVSDSPANDWDPCIAADTKEDRVWVGWDTYATGCYSVRIRSVVGARGQLEQIDNMPMQQQALCNRHITLACDGAGRLWVAWDVEGQEWGKDAGFLYESSKASRLYQRRKIDVQVRSDERWVSPGFHLPQEMEFGELPQLESDGDKRVWLAFRQRTCRRPREDGWAAQARWDVFVTMFRGNRWSAPVPLLYSAGRNDMRIGSQHDRGGNVYFSYASDNRSWTPPAMTERGLSIAVSRLPADRPLFHASVFGILEQDTKPAQAPAVHPNEKAQVARVRAYKIDHGGKTYRIYRGDLHRHTDISGDGVGDGSLMDLHRYGLDAAAMDLILVGDHNMGNDREYSWWRTQKANDLYTVPGKFISMYGYERSVRYPNGHRNIIWTERGHRTLPLPNPAIPAQMAKDTERLYAYLRDTGGICTAHTSATEQGTDWKDFDGSLEPIVEIFQGFHTSYEMEGAPLAITKDSKIVHQGFRPDGFVSKALDKGYRLGFQASSDHVSTHVSYACVLAEEFSRKGLVEAMKKRHTYAATDNIILDVRAGKLGIMGDEIATNEPQLDVIAIGTGPIDRAEVVRNGKVVHTAKPQAASEELRFTWQDPNPEKGKTSYYYVRVIQQNKHMAWASPVWVKVD